MRTRTLIYTLLVVVMAACSEERMPENEALSPIRLSVVSSEGMSSRANLYGGTSSIVAEGEFALDAYLMDGNDTPYLKNTWIYYFGDWRFRDKTYQGKLLDYYWPNDHRVNFLAYMPYDLSKTFVERDDIKFTNAGGFSFNCTLPETAGDDRVVNDRTETERAAENNIHEFVYALRKDCQKGETDKDPVKLHFVHPFAAIKFRLSQSHRDLTIHSITLTGVSNAATYTHAEDTYDKYLDGQSTLTYSAWQATATGTFTVKYEKKVPQDINYYSLIGGPYLVIPQTLADVTLSVNYSWDTTIKGNTTEVKIATAEISAWNPGMIYTYTLDLGDNKEEILFKATVEPWTKGEDDGYENEYEVN